MHSDSTKILPDKKGETQQYNNKASKHIKVECQHTTCITILQIIFHLKTTGKFH